MHNLSRRAFIAATPLPFAALLAGCNPSTMDATLARVQRLAAALLSLADKYRGIVPADLYTVISDNVAAIQKLTGGDWLTVARGAADLLVKAAVAVMPLLPLPAPIIAAAQTAIGFVRQVFAPVSPWPAAAASAAAAAAGAPAMVTDAQADAALAQLTMHVAVR